MLPSFTGFYRCCCCCDRISFFFSASYLASSYLVLPSLFLLHDLAEVEWNAIVFFFIVRHLVGDRSFWDFLLGFYRVS